jgi:hypothetical protein
MSRASGPVRKGGASMQTPVRFYITQDDDQPVVRTIPVASHPIPRVKPANTQPAEQATGPRAPRKVSKLVRFATRRADQPQ